MFVFFPQKKVRKQIQIYICSMQWEKARNSLLFLEGWPSLLFFHCYFLLFLWFCWFPLLLPSFHSALLMHSSKLPSNASSLTALLFSSLFPSLLSFSCQLTSSNCCFQVPWNLLLPTVSLSSFSKGHHPTIPITVFTKLPLLYKGPCVNCTSDY